MNNIKPCNLIQNRIDLKASTLTCLSTTIDILMAGEIENVSLGSDTKLIVLTNFGIIEGTPFPDSKEDQSGEDLRDVVTKTLMEKVFEIRNNSISEKEESNPNLKLINDSSSILLKDVIITPYSNLESKTKLGILSLFTDQIVGLSFGEYSVSTL